MLYFGAWKSDRDDLKMAPGIEKWIKKLTMRFKIPTGVAPWLFVDEKYTLSDVYIRQGPAYYIRAIIQYSIGANILDVPN